MTDALKVLNYDSVLGIQEARGFGETLKHLLDSGYNIIINMGKTSSLDLACIQVFLAAKKYSMQHKLNLQLANQISSEVLFALYTAGVIKSASLSGKEVNKAIENLVSGRM